MSDFDNVMTNVYTGKRLGDLISYEGDEPYLFVSYSHADTDEVYPFLKKLEREKFRIWYDDTMETGEDFREELRSKIEGCRAVLLFVSNNSMKSRYCGMEIITAFANKKKILPVYVNEKEVQIPPALDMILTNLQHVNIGIGEGVDRAVQRLIPSIPVETMHSLDVVGEALVQCKDGSDVIAIPTGVKEIGESAFKNCEKLVEVHLGTELTTIRREAFRGCKSLTEIELPANVTLVGESAFRDCISLTTLKVDNKDVEIGERAFENCASLVSVSLRPEMTEIYGGVFNSCKSLASINLPEQLTILGESCFADCVSITEINVPKKVNKIDDMVFNGCTGLEKITLPDGLLKIGKAAFKDCTSLESIYIPASVTTMGAGPLRGCTSLSTVEVDKKNRFFKTENNILFNKNKSILIAYPPRIESTEYKIPDSVVTVSDWAFCGCKSLRKIEIPDSVYEIGEGAFYMCEGLEEIVVPDSVEKIDDTAFRGCTQLKRITIPDSVKELGWGLFNGCSHIEVICSDGSAAARYCDNKGIPHNKEA
ncbi:MAG: leucine-rich repeat protein [Clostridia bacterium]|nr:leucine-rich repeat protein [Clostridia bacterium]